MDGVHRIASLEQHAVSGNKACNDEHRGCARETLPSSAILSTSESTRSVGWTSKGVVVPQYSTRTFIDQIQSGYVVRWRRRCLNHVPHRVTGFSVRVATSVGL